MRWPGRAAIRAICSSWHERAKDGRCTKTYTMMEGVYVVNAAQLEKTAKVDTKCGHRRQCVTVFQTRAGEMWRP